MADEVKGFTDLLEDSNPVVRREAARALGVIGRTARAAIPALRKALGDTDLLVREAAAEALERIVEKLTVDEFRRVIVSPMVPVDRRQRACEELVRVHGDTAEVVRLLRGFLLDNDLKETVSGLLDTIEKDRTAVTGMVAVDGFPLTSGTVALVPETGRPITGEISENGTYRIAGIPPGRYRITVDGPLARPVPPVYTDAKTTPLSCEARSGMENYVNLALTARP
jgi:hypothetical protein